MIILGTNSIKETGFNVANSLRLGGSNESLSFSESTTPTGLTKFTLSTWIKRSKLGSDQVIMFNAKDGSNFAQIYFRGSQKDIRYFDRVGGGDTCVGTTDMLFNDVGAFYHIVLRVDTTLGTAGDRVRIYVNGNEVAFTFDNTPSQDQALTLNNTGTKYIGVDSSSGNYFGGYHSEFCWIDGSSLAPDQFGEFDEDSGIWKPIDVSGLTFGNNGFYLNFETAAELGTDVSGNSNTFTESNLTAVDQSTDTCTNNFCTMNPLYPDGTITFSEGNLKLTEGNSWRSAGGTMAVSTGKWFWEVSNVGNYAYIGFADIQLFSEGCSIRESFTTGAATTGRAHSVLNSDGRHYQVTSGGAQSSEYPSGATFPTFTNSIISIALNLDDNNFIFYKDGTAMNPSGTAISITAGTYIPAVSIYGNNVSYNFGSPPYSESGGNSDGNGYGNFSMAVPSGYYSLNTKNLAEFG